MVGPRQASPQLRLRYVDTTVEMSKSGYRLVIATVIVTCLVATPALSFLPIPFKVASSLAHSVVVAEYHSWPLWLSHFRIHEVLKGSAEIGDRIYTVREDLLGDGLIDGHRYVVLLDEDADPFQGRSACGTFNVLVLNGDELANPEMYGSEVTTEHVTISDIRRDSEADLQVGQ